MVLTVVAAVVLELEVLVVGKAPEEASPTDDTEEAEDGRGRGGEYSFEVVEDKETTEASRCRTEGGATEATTDGWYKLGEGRGRMERSDRCPVAAADGDVGVTSVPVAAAAVAVA